MEQDAFIELILQARGDQWRPPGALLALDPGDTTGWALFREGCLADCGQVPGNARSMAQLLVIAMPTGVVYEDYILYAHKAAEQHWSNMPVSKLIGAIELLCEQQEIPYFSQLARDAKGFVSDLRLRELHLYQQNKKHANDAIRHGVYALLFSKQLI